MYYPAFTHAPLLDMAAPGSISIAERCTTGEDKLKLVSAGLD
jgi:hypothetical protein